MWMGGLAPSELRRIGRLADGWLPSFCTPDDVRAGIAEINRVAEENERSIDPGHMGALVVYGDSELPPAIGELIAQRRPDLSPSDLVATSHQALKDRIEAFVEAGASKFVAVPIAEPTDWTAELEAVAETVLPLQN